VAGDNAFSILHWSTPEEPYCGENTVCLPWQFGQANEHRFTLPAGVQSVSSLRWDITECPAACSVAHLWIEDPSGQLIWEWFPGTPLFDFRSADMQVLGKTSENALEIISTGVDPYGELLIPQEILARLQAGATFCAVWTAQFPSVGLTGLIGWLRNAAAELQRIEVEAAGLEARMTEAQSQLAAQSRELLELRIHRDQVRGEIARAEGQLQLLKDLWKNIEPGETL
jgi:hypothetical protein